MNPSVVVAIPFFLASFFVTVSLVPLIIQFAYRYNIVDRPDGFLKMHEQATPYLGGVAVFLGFFVAMLFIFFIVVPVDVPFVYTAVFSFMNMGMFGLLLLGLADDLYRFNAVIKWLWQIIIVALFIIPPTLVFMTPAATVLYGIWALAVINMFNLIDVMDGLATTVALCAVVALMVVRSGFWLIPDAAFAGALAGFLWFNRPPARIYLGDAGSLLIGGFFAQAPLLFVANHYFATNRRLEFTQMFAQFVVPGFILLIPALEVFTLIVIRWRKGVPFYQGSHDHFAHYLLRKGWSKNTILGYVIALSLVLGTLSWLFTQGILNLPMLLFCATAFVAFWYTVLFFL